MDLPERGEVLTLCGWKPYRNPRISKRDARLVEVAFDDGSTVRCTPDHLFLTVRGWTSASDLLTGSLIQSASIPSRSTLRGGFTGSFLLKGISETKEFCTVMYGRLRSGLHRMGATFITAMGTLPTISYATSSASMLGSTSAWSGRSGEPRGQSQKLAKKCDQKLLSGTGAQRGGSGTAGTPSGQKAGRSGSGLRRLVCIAGRCIKGWFVPETHKSTAAKPARSLRIESVVNLSETADVWDITVPSVKHFALANGAVVHNSADAFRTGAVVMPRDTYTVKEAPVFPGEVTFDDALKEHDRLVKENAVANDFKRI
jgi:hypothetical protein